MASFSTEVKNELAHVRGREMCCIKAELLALLRLSGYVFIKPNCALGLKFKTRHAAVARTVLSLFKKISPRLTLEILVSRSDRFKKHNQYILKALPSDETDELLNLLGIFRSGEYNLDGDGDLMRRACCRAAYLRGAFLGGGSVNRPDVGCHLEFVLESYQTAVFVRDLMRRFQFPVGLTERKENYIVYLKEGEAIIDFLTMIRAPLSAEQMEAGRNLKEVRAQVNRLVNCETANVAKSADASARQAADVRLLMRSAEWDKLPEVMRQTGEMRLKYPEAGLSELAALLFVSKSGLNHRFRKFRALAAKLFER